LIGLLPQREALSADQPTDATHEATGYYGKFGGILAIIVMSKGQNLNAKTTFAMRTKQLSLAEVARMTGSMKKEDIDWGGVSGVSVYSIERGKPVSVEISRSGVQVLVNDPSESEGSGGGGAGGSGGSGGSGGGGAGGK
jgi:uncharacterized membrane protein YgcG